MEEQQNLLPIVDFSSAAAAEASDKELLDVGEQLVEAFSTTGFVYLVNIGVSDETINEANTISGKFFNLPPDVKEKYPHNAATNHGYIRTEQESLKPDEPGDLKEVFNCSPVGEQSWPEEEVPGFRQFTADFIAQCQRLSTQILRALAVGLGLQDKEYFVNFHKEQTRTTLRYLIYPSLSSAVKPGQTRCGEHSDYGSITLLFQDAVGGLQVMSRQSGWVDAVPVPGSVLVNIGDLMQRWTSDRLVSTRHRVVIPAAEVARPAPRRSMAYFVHPDSHLTISCIDGSDKYPPVNSLDYINMKFGQIY